MSGPFELLGDPDAAVCEGESCALPAEPPREPQDPGDERETPPA